MIISKMWAVVLPVRYSLKTILRQINGPKTRLTSYRWFKTSLDKRYQVNHLKYKHFDISHMIISKLWAAGLQVCKR